MDTMHQHPPARVDRVCHVKQDILQLRLELNTVLHVVEEDSGKLPQPWVLARRGRDHQGDVIALYPLLHVPERPRPI